MCAKLKHPGWDFRHHSIQGLNNRAALVSLPESCHATSGPCPPLNQSQRLQRRSVLIGQKWSVFCGAGGGGAGVLHSNPLGPEMEGGCLQSAASGHNRAHIYKEEFPKQG